MSSKRQQSSSTLSSSRSPSGSRSQQNSVQKRSKQTTRGQKRSASVARLYSQPVMMQRTAPLLGSLVISVSLSGCDQDTPDLYASVQQCSQVHPQYSCQDSYNRAINAALAHRKKYLTKQSCEAAYHYKKCILIPDQEQYILQLADFPYWDEHQGFDYGPDYSDYYIGTDPVWEQEIQQNDDSNCQEDCHGHGGSFSSSRGAGHIAKAASNSKLKLTAHGRGGFGSAVERHSIWQRQEYLRKAERSRIRYQRSYRRSRRGWGG